MFRSDISEQYLNIQKDLSNWLYVEVIVGIASCNCKLLSFNS
jgi:hypothetical protein